MCSKYIEEQQTVSDDELHLPPTASESVENNTTAQIISSITAATTL